MRRLVLLLALIAGFLTPHLRAEEAVGAVGAIGAPEPGPIGQTGSTGTYYYIDSVTSPVAPNTSGATITVTGNLPSSFSPTGYGLCFYTGDGSLTPLQPTSTGSSTATFTVAPSTLEAIPSSSFSANGTGTVNASVYFVYGGAACNGNEGSVEGNEYTVQVTIPSISPSTLPANSPGTTITLSGDLPTFSTTSPGYGLCAFTGYGAGATPLQPNGLGSGTANFVVPASTIQDVPASAFNANGSFPLQVYLTQSTSCTDTSVQGGFALGTQVISLEVPSLQNVFATGFAPLGHDNRDIPAQVEAAGSNFVSQSGGGTQAYTYLKFTAGGSTTNGQNTSQGSSTTVVNMTPNGVGTTDNGATGVSVQACNAGSTANVECSPAVTVPVPQAVAVTGTLTATPNPALPTQTIALAAQFTPATTGTGGAPGGPVTFTSVNSSNVQTTLGTTNLQITPSTGQFAAGALTPIVTQEYQGGARHSTAHTAFRGRTGVRPADQPLGNAAGFIPYITDFNKDGIPDLLLYGEDYDGALHLYLGSAPGGSYYDAGTLALPFGCYDLADLAVGDVNGDGYPDVVMLCGTEGGNQIYVGYNQGGTGLGNFVAIGSTSPTQQVALGDFNGDGKLDILTDGSTAFSSDTYQFQIYLQGASGNFSSTPITIASQYAEGQYLTVADFNKDGLADIAIYNSQIGNSPAGISVFQNPGGGNFSATPTVTVPVAAPNSLLGPFFATPLAPGGFPALLYPIAGADGYTESGFGVALNSGTSTIAFGAPTTYPVAGLQEFFPGDFNGDGFTDVVTNDGTTTNLLLGSSTGVFTAAPSTWSSTQANTMPIGVSDQNGDGYADVVAINQQSSSSGQPGAVQVLLTTGTASATLTASPQAPGTYTLSASYAGTPFLTAATGSTNLQVNGLQPVVTFTTAPLQAITYGTALSSAQLSAVATYAGQPVQGTFVYTLADGTVVNAGSIVPVGTGTQVLTATFTPSNNLYNSASGTASLPVNKATPTLTLTPIGNQTYGGPPVTVNANSTSAASPITYSVTGPASLSGNTLSFTGVGTVTVTANQAASANYNAAAPATTTFTVSAQAATLTITPIPNQTFGGPAVTVNATSTSPAPITYSVTGPASLSGTTLTFTGAGPVTVTANQAATGTYAAATASTNFTVAPATPVLSITPIPNQTYGGPPVTVSATSTSTASPITYSVTGPASLSGNKLTFTGLGTVTVTANQAASANYTAAAPVSTTFTVSAQATTLTVTPIAAQTFGGPPVTVSATSSSPAPITYTVSGPASLSGTTLTFTGAGPVTVTANQVASGTFAAATAFTTFTVNKATPVLTITPIGNQVYGGPAVTVSATSTSTASPISYTVSGPATLSGNSLSFTGLGTVTVTANQAPSANYNAPAPVSTIFTVSAQAGILTLAPIATQTFGGPAVTVSATSSSPAPITYSVSGPATLSGTTLTLTGAGTVSVTASQVASGTFAATTASTTFTVNKATPTLTLTPIPNQTYGGSPVTVSATSTSTASPITYTVSGPAALSGTSLSFTGAGSVTVTASQAATANYNAASTSTTFTVGVSGAKITLAPIANQTFGGSPVKVNATSTSTASPLTYTVTGPATLSGTTLTLTGAGTVTVTANQAASANYAAATASTTFTVAKATPTITWPTPTAVVAGTVLTSAQLDATVAGVNGAVPAGSLNYTPALGSVVTSGTETLSVTFVSTDPNYTNATKTVRLPVSPATLVSVSPSTITLSSASAASTPVTLTGTGFASDAKVLVNGTAVPTQVVSSTTLIASIPASDLTIVTTLGLQVTEAQENQTTVTLPLSVVAPPVAITIAGPSTVGSAEDTSLTLPLTNPYPADLTGQLTLSFQPYAGSMGDETILFTNGSTIMPIFIPANSTITPVVALQNGTVAGTITLTLTLSAGGVPVPSGTITKTIVIPPAAPTINTATWTLSGTTLTVTVTGFSNTRDIAKATFHFGSSSGPTISTPDQTITGGDFATQFSDWFGSATSQPYGSSFLYTQTFQISNDVTGIDQVTVTLVNSVGSSPTKAATGP